jgi:uncharacterized protein (TIGR03118 family)
VGWRRPVVEILEERCLLDSTYVQTNLVSDIPGMAPTIDSNLKNPWGMTASPTGPFWVSDNNTGVSTLYKGSGTIVPLVVTIPAAGGGPGGSPSGIVFNGTGGFQVSQGGNSGSAFFIFATEDGTISGWNPGVNLTNAVIAVNNSSSGALYEGLALANNGSGNFLYATNFTAGTIDVFNSQFQPATLSGSFTDPNLPAGYTPYGIQPLNGNLYVTYVPSNFSSGGLIDVYDTNGNFQQRLVAGGNLDFPWGMTIAPGNFGKFSNALLVGNLFDGHINAYNPNSGAFRGQLDLTDGTPFTEPGLWSLRFGNDGAAGSSHTLFFTAGINGYADGLLGSLTPGKKEKHGDAAAGLGQNPNTGTSTVVLTVLAKSAAAAPAQIVVSTPQASVSGATRTALATPGPQNFSVAQSQVGGAGSLRTAHVPAVDQAFADFDLTWSGS